MIVGTAGHIDHGKTTLVRALTGVDTDRLPEEKARGMSIELGYAYLDVPGSEERIGFIDVPGHERLVHTMLAGATGIDFALLLVAADDGVMPQTREHVALLSLLGLTRGAVALTKVDRVEAGRVDEVRAEVKALLAATPLATAPVFPVSALAGEGIPALRDRLLAAAGTRDQVGAAASEAPRTASRLAAFRLAIDRAFTLTGIGTVVTGTVHAGQVRIGDELVIAPSDDPKRARVRSLHAQDRVVAQARAGQRCALALAGITKDEVGRGQWLVAPEAATRTTRLDASLTLWQGETRPLRSGTPVHVHTGAGDALGTVAVLQADPCGDVAAPQDLLAPGRHAFVQIVLRKPIAAWRGDRIVLRDASASRALAGGIVLDPFAPARYRRTRQRLAELAAWALPDPACRLEQLIAAAPHGVLLSRWALAEGDIGDLRPRLLPGSLRAAGPASGDWGLGPVHREAVIASALTALRDFHRREPEMLGPDAARLRRLAAPRLPEPLWQALLDGLQESGQVALRGAFVQLPEHGLRLSATDERLAQRIAPLLATAGFEGVWARDLAQGAREGEALMRTTIARLAQRGELHQVVKDLCYPQATIARLAGHARTIAQAEGGAVTAARFRDATGLGRKRAIQILEYFDRIGMLRRVGDAHRLRGDSAHFSTLP